MCAAASSFASAGLFVMSQDFVCIGVLMGNEDRNNAVRWEAQPEQDSYDSSCPMSKSHCKHRKAGNTSVLMTCISKC